MIKKIWSGGQTGVDRAGLDIAIELGIPHEGWCPKGRLAEDGVISPKYKLTETASSDPAERTKLNIRDADATLIIVPAFPIQVKDGTQLTYQAVLDTGKDHWVFDISKEKNVNRIVEWIQKNKIENLNIAGPKESLSPGIYQQSCEILRHVFKALL